MDRRVGYYDLVSDSLEAFHGTLSRRSRSPGATVGRSTPAGSDRGKRRIVPAPTQRWGVVTPSGSIWFVAPVAASRRRMACNSQREVHNGW